MGSFSGVGPQGSRRGPQGSRGGRDRGRRERRRGTAWRQLGEPPFFLATVLAQTQSLRGGHAAPHRHPRRSCGSHLGAARAGGRGGRRPGRFCGQKVVCQPGEAAEVDAAGTAGRAPSHAASPLPRILPTGRVTGHGAHWRLHAARDLEPQLELGSQPHFPRGPALPSLGLRVPSHPLTAPRPLPPAPPPGRSSRPSCRRLLKLHVFHFSDVFDCTAVFFLFLFASPGR